MKAHIERGKSPEKTQEKIVRAVGPGPYHGHPIRLTIGMIVKDEEKTLDRCLKSLQPLRDAVESELIITDTGSTDRTVEIAQKYTDHILHFQWCGDFSAARNTGIEAARGEWFLFLDGDEWFENTDDLIRFFKSGECDRYGSASYVVRNYNDFKGKNYCDFHAFRLSRMYEGIHFRNIVHEDLVRCLPTKFLGDFVHHYGYVFHSEGEKREKYQRNIGLLKKELEDDSNDLKAYCQIADQYFSTDEIENVEKYCKLGFQVEKEHPDHFRRAMLAHSLVRAYFSSGRYAEVLDAVEELFRTDHKIEITWLDFLYLAQAAAFNLKKYERSEAYGREYLRIYQLYQSDQLDKTMLMAMIHLFLEPKNKEEVLCLMGEACLKLKQFQRAKEILPRLDLSERESLRRQSLFTCHFCSETGGWQELTAFYGTVLAVQGESCRANLVKLLESLLPGEPEKRQAAARAFAALPDGDDAYVRLCRLRKAEAEAARDAATEELDWFCGWKGEWDPLFSDAVFYTMTEKRNLVPLILKIDADDRGRYTANMQRQHSNFAEVVREYFNFFSFDSLRGLAWSVCLMEKVLLQEQNPFVTEEEEIWFFEEYAGQLAKVVRALYRPELLSKDKVSVLPRTHRFGYYMGLALTARKRSEDAAYLSNLRLALQCYPVMERQISLLLTRFERESREKRAKAEEFSKLAKQVKTNIRALIAQNRLEEAGRFTAQLAALMPDDPDVIQFRTLTHTEPDMNELAARLPQ